MITLAPVPAIKEPAFEDQEIRNGATLLSINENRHLTGRAPMTQQYFTQRQKDFGIYRESRATPVSVPAPPAPSKPAPPARPKALGDAGSTLERDLRAKANTHSLALGKANDELSRVEGLASEMDEEIAALKAGGSAHDAEAVQRLSLLLARKELLPNDVAAARKGLLEAQKRFIDILGEFCCEANTVLKFLEEEHKARFRANLAGYYSDPKAIESILGNIFHQTDFATEIKALRDERNGMRTIDETIVESVGVPQTLDWLQKVDAFSKKWLPQITGETN